MLIFIFSFFRSPFKTYDKSSIFLGILLPLSQSKITGKNPLPITTRSMLMFINLPSPLVAPLSASYESNIILHSRSYLYTSSFLVNISIISLFLGKFSIFSIGSGLRPYFTSCFLAISFSSKVKSTLKPI